VATDGQNPLVQSARGRLPFAAAWRREASPLYKALFLAALLVLGGSFLAGLVESVRTFGLPPIQGDATVLGQALLERREYAAALEEFRLAALLDPENYGAGPQLSFTPEPPTPESLERLRQAAREHPGSASAQLALGRALLAQGDLAASVASLERARELDPGEPGLAAALGRAYLVSGRYEESERALREALAVSPHPDLHDLMGFALHQRGLREDAARHFERASALRAQRSERNP
jgi:tetratricopeptide (TPR) repeat protein